MIAVTPKHIANRLAARYHTRDVFELAHALGYTVLFTPLAGLRGMYKNIHRCATIIINSNLDEHQQRLVCAHEIGHDQMHRGINRIFLDRCTHMTTAKYENEAHKFSVDLLYADDELQDMLEWPIEHVARFMGVPPWLAEYRMRSVEPKFRI